MATMEASQKNVNTTNSSDERLSLGEAWAYIRGLGYPVRKATVARITGYRSGENALIAMENHGILFFEHDDGRVEPFIR